MKSHSLYVHLLLVSLLQSSPASSQYNLSPVYSANLNTPDELCQISGTIINCSHMSLTKVPDYIPANVTVLDLSYNRIHQINQSLSRFERLQELYLGNNIIDRLHIESLKGLTNLLILDLQGNKLKMNNKTFPQGVFAPLKSLRILRLNNNNVNITDRSLMYPDKALSDLKNLVSLDMDGLANKDFGSKFESMPSLRNLTMEGPPLGYCHIESLNKDTFKYLSRLQVLNIRFCFINGSLIDPRALKPLVNLQILDLSGNDFIHLQHLGPALAAMDSVSLTHLNIHNIMNPYSPCIKVTNQFARSLPRSLTHITASSNGLAMMESEVLESLPKNLTYLDVSDNRFTFGSYLKNFSKLINLETLELNGAVQSFSLPSYYPQQEDDIEYHQLFDVKASFLKSEHVILTLPPKLNRVSINSAGLTYKLSEFHFDPNNSLEHLVLDGNKIQSLEGPLTGLNKLKRLSLVDCYISEINERFFENFESLEFLNLSTNTFGGNALKKGQKPIFSSLKNLKELDISFVNIITIDKDAFAGLESLEKLHIQRNGFYYSFINISHLRNLHFVNFSFTELSSLSLQVRNFFDSIAHSNNLTIDFSENPIHCYCANVYFIAWLSAAMDYIHFKRLNWYKCVYEDISEKYFHNFQDLYQLLDRQCHPRVALFFIVTSATLLFVCVIVILVIYKFRWKLKYLYYSAYLHFQNKKRSRDDNEDYEFDVFVSFASEDDIFIYEKIVPELESRGLRVLIHTADFKPGEFITTNIVNAVHSSRKTLIVLSSNLLKSTWCHFELQMANMESLHTGRPVMVFLLMQQLPEEVLSRELLYHIQNNTYIQLPVELDNARTMDIFWTKLCSDLKE